MRADNARPGTVKDYLDTLRQYDPLPLPPPPFSAGLAQQWCNAYRTGTFSRGGDKSYKPLATHATRSGEETPGHLGKVSG